MIKLKKLLKKLKPARVKNSGNTLFVTIILSGLIISVGLGMLGILTKEIKFSFDLLLSERAYFAAESGVEVALAELKENPVEYVENYEINLGGAKTLLNIDNSVSEFNMPLAPLETVKFRLKKDSSPDLDEDFGVIENFGLSRSPEKDFWWKILCRDSEGNTISLQVPNRWDANLPVGQHFMGVYDDKDGKSLKNVSSGEFFGELSPEEKKSCFFSVTNLDEEEEVVFVLTTPNGERMAPYHAEIKSTGQAGDTSFPQEKTIIFGSTQKGLSSFFDFGLLHK
ncbi:MAG: hypothetical protein OEL89_05530 [Candidatus Peregrinibacteria bacterium]|nr:hypothetical protein [Candidatus Peregrinibacteria bacterium]